MERLMKLMEYRGSAIENRSKADPIFDVKAYQRACQHNLFSTSFQYTHSTSKRLSFSEYSSKPKADQASLKGMGRLLMKEQIKPHESKLQQKRVVQRIREKIGRNMFLSKTDSPNDSITSSQLKNKKASHSAYLIARKRIFQNQSSIGTSSQIQYRQKEKRQMSPEMSNRQILQKQSQLLFLKPIYFDQLQALNKRQEKNRTQLQNNNEDIEKRTNFKYLDRVIAHKRRENTSRVQQFNIITSKFKPRQGNQTPIHKNGFISVTKRKSSIFNLTTNSHKPKSNLNIDAPQQSSAKPYFNNFLHQKSLEEEDIELFPSIKKQKLNPNGIFNKENFKEISSKAVSIIRVKDQIVNTIFSFNDRQKVQIASVTKIMTCFLVLTIADKFCLNIKKEKLMVSERASKMSGTSAKFAYSDICTVYEMLHGLMLPSGNDAAVALGEWGGKVIRRYSANLRKMKADQSPTKSQKALNYLEAFASKRKSHLKLFIHHMNKLAKFLQLKNTYFANTHGLMNEKAYSCSHDVSLLTFYAMNNDIFAQIVEKKSFQCTVFNRTFSHKKEALWENTNKLLGVQGFVGVKTGVTPAAGPCLASCFQINSAERFIIVILRTKSCEMRFKETIALLKTTIEQLIDESDKQKFIQYQKALLRIDKYSNIDSPEREQQFLNDCKQSSTSNTDRDEGDDLDLPNYP